MRVIKNKEEENEKYEWCNNCEDYAKSPHICYIRALRDKRSFYQMYEPEQFDAL